MPPDLSTLNYSPGRRVKNEHLFAEANMRILKMTRPVLEQAGNTDFPIDFVCECADANCQEKISLPIKTFLESHDQPNYFFVKPGHVHSDIEKVRERSNSHWIVEKFVPAEKESCE